MVAAHLAMQQMRSGPSDAWRQTLQAIWDGGGHQAAFCLGGSRWP
jgi:uncharacterized protein YraI